MSQDPSRPGQAPRGEDRTVRSEGHTVPSDGAPQGRLAGRVLPFEPRQRRRATDAKKPPCPWCGGCTSSVYRSKGVITSERYRRRRQCADCGGDWPTVEGLDTELFARELAARGLTLEDLAADNPAGQRRAADGRRRRE